MEFRLDSLFTFTCLIRFLSLNGYGEWDVQVETFELDIEDLQAVAGLGAQVGPIDVLINNAGTVHGGAFLDVSMRDHQRTANVNFTGLMAVTHALLPEMLTQPAATIVNIASAASFVCGPYGFVPASWPGAS